MRTLHLDTLKQGLPKISPAFGTFLAEAAAVCLTHMGHQSGVRLSVEGDFEAKFSLKWTQIIGEREKASWRDLREMTEYGATAISILLMSELASFDTFERANQGFGFDYYLKNTVSPTAVLKKAKLEISGILKEIPGNTIQIRISKKQIQVDKQTKINLPGFISVIEFGFPKAKIVSK